MGILGNEQKCLVGDERARSGFLFRPKLINGEVRRWRWSTWVEEYTELQFGWVYRYFWRPVRWVD
jgi:hypothetical protein